MKEARTWRRSALLLAVLAGAAVPASAAFTIRPYLQHPGTTQMTVMWESDTLDEAAVTIRRDGEAPKVVSAPAPVTTTYLEDPANPASHRYARQLYAVKLTGLLPGTKYTYAVKSGAAAAKPSFFHTFPERADAFTFIAYGDSRSNPAVHKKVAANFAQYKPAFILHSGDMVGSGKRQDQWVTDFFEPLADVIDHIPLFGVRGNHDGDGVILDRFLSPPDGSLGYAFDYGTAHVLCLDMSDKPGDIEWADRDLAACTATWRFALCHYPNFNVGGHSSAWGRNTVVPMFRRHHVDVAISGHSHLYERFHPLVPLGDPGAHPITYIVSGGGGAPKYGTVPNPCLAEARSLSHFVVVRVAGDRVTLEARDADNERFDSVTISKKDGAYDPAYLASVMPEEVVSLQNALKRGLRVKIADLPAPGKPVAAACRYAGAVMEFPAELTLSLTEESKKAYALEPQAWKVNAGDGQETALTLQLRARQRIGFDDHGKLGPALALVCRYRVGDVEGAVTKNIDWKPLLDLAAGWQALGEPPPADRRWSYRSFDPEEKDALPRREKKRFRMVTLPKGLEEWYRPGFDAGGWTTGKAPIGKGLFKHGETTFKNNADWGPGEFLLMRTAFVLAETDYDFIRIRALAKQGFRIYLNGHEVHNYAWWKDAPEYRPILLTPEGARHLVKGTNVIAVYSNVEYKKNTPVGQADFYLEGLRMKP